MVIPNSCASEKNRNVEEAALRPCPRAAAMMEDNRLPGLCIFGRRHNYRSRAMSERFNVRFGSMADISLELPRHEKTRGGFLRAGFAILAMMAFYP
jgi:hypothetical protein